MSSVIHITTELLWSGDLKKEKAATAAGRLINRDIKDIVNKSVVNNTNFKTIIIIIQIKKE